MSTFDISFDWQLYHNGVYMRQEEIQAFTWQSTEDDFRGEFGSVETYFEDALFTLNATGSLISILTVFLRVEVWIGSQGCDLYAFSMSA